MYQADRGNYRTNESMGKAFMHSCLGKLIIFVAFILVVLIIAYFTTPTEKEMTVDMEDNIMQCLEANDSIKGDPIDDYVTNLGAIFSEADSTKVAEEVRQATTCTTVWRYIAMRSMLLPICATTYTPREYA